MSQEIYNQQKLLTITHVVRPWQTATRADGSVSESLLEQYDRIRERADVAMRDTDPVKLIREQRD